MPTYDYLCKSDECKHTFEALDKSWKNPQIDCPVCKKSTLVRLITKAPHRRIDLLGVNLANPRNAPISHDLNKKYSKMAKSYVDGNNRKLGKR